MKMNVILTTAAVLLACTEAGPILAAKWDQVEGKLERISKGLAGVWGVNTAEDIFTMADGGAWVKVAGKLVQVSSGSSVWGVNRNEDIWRYKGDGQWDQIKGKLTNVAVSNADHVWGVNSAGLIWRWLGDSWQLIEGNAKQVSVGESGVWVVNTNDDIYYRTGTFRDYFTAGTGWVKVPGKLKWIGSGVDIVVGVNANDDIWYRTGVSDANPIGDDWVKVPGKLMQIDADGDQVVGVNSGNNIWQSPIES